MTLVETLGKNAGTGNKESHKRILRVAINCPQGTSLSKASSAPALRAFQLLDCDDFCPLSEAYGGR
jgi:hypothetical protein